MAKADAQSTTRRKAAHRARHDRAVMAWSRYRQIRAEMNRYAATHPLVDWQDMPGARRLARYADILRFDDATTAEGLFAKTAFLEDNLGDHSTPARQGEILKSLRRSAAMIAAAARTDGQAGGKRHHG